jgi:methionine-rich copper-binding protein CopC
MKVIRKGLTIFLMLFLTLLAGCVEGESIIPELSGIADVTIEVGDTFDPMAGITATWSGQDLTSLIKITGKVDTSKAGVYTLEYSVTSSKGDIAKLTRKVTVVERAIINPIINGADDVSVEWGADFDPMAGVTATWNEEDITLLIEVSGEVDTSKAGVYTLEYSVESDDGGVATKTRKVTVLERGVIMPVIHGATDVSVEYGDPFNAQAGVIATWNGRDITNRITITGEVNTSKAGVYTLVYRVESEDGGVATKTRKVTVLEKQVFKENEKTSTTLHNVEHIKANGDVTNDKDVVTYQEVNVFKQGDGILVANWSKFNNDGKYVLSSTLNIAKDFELNNLNYEVIAAVNGDFFYAQSGITYNVGPNILFGNRVVKPDNFYAGYYYSLHFNQFGEKLGVYKTLTALSGLNLMLYNEDGALVYHNNEILLDKKTVLNDGETTVIFKKAFTYDSATTYFILNQKNQYTLGAHIFFEAGVGNKITTSNESEVVIATKDPALINQLKSNQRVIVQKMTAKVGLNDMVIGIDSAIIEDSVIKQFSEMNNDTDEQRSRNVNRNPRTGVGFDENGKMVLITVDGRGVSKGVDYRELAGIMQYYGIVDGYGLDGGGSTQAVFRVNGELTYVNTPSERDPYRGVANALLFIREKEAKPTYDLKVGKGYLTLNIIDKTNISEVEILVNGKSNKYSDITNEIRVEIEGEKAEGVAIYYTKNGTKRHLTNEIISGVRKYFNVNNVALYDFEKGYSFAQNIGYNNAIYQFTKEQWQAISDIVDDPGYSKEGNYKMANLALLVTDAEGKVIALRLYQKWVDDPQSGIQLTVDADGNIIAQLQGAFSRNNVEIGVNALVPEGGFVYVFATPTPSVDDGFSAAMKFAYKYLLGLDPSLFESARLNGEPFTDWTNPPINPFAEGFRVTISAEPEADDRQTYIKIGDKEYIAELNTYQWDASGGVGAIDTHALIFSKAYLASMPGYGTVDTADDAGKNYTIQYSILAITDANGKIVQIRIHPGHKITWDTATNDYKVEDTLTPKTLQHGLLDDIPDGGYVFLFQNTNLPGNPIRAWGCQQLTGFADVTGYANADTGGVANMTVNPFVDGFIIEIIKK